MAQKEFFNLFSHSSLQPRIAGPLCHFLHRPLIKSGELMYAFTLGKDWNDFALAMLELSCYLWFERFRKVVKYFEMNSGGPNHRPFAVHESVKQILSRSVIVKVPRKFP